MKMKKIRMKTQHFVITGTSNQNSLIMHGATIKIIKSEYFDSESLSFGICVTDSKTAEDSTKQGTKPTDHCTLSSNFC
jgi:hypothetical protein